MANLVPSNDIERIVGVTRHPTRHYGRAVSAEQTFYILHSQECKDSGIDLRDCMFSIAVDRGIDLDVWADHEDVAVQLRIRSGLLVPFTRLELR